MSWTKLEYEQLGEQEKLLIEQVVRRMRQGQRDYGEWDVHDGRDYPKEALDEVIDALHYAAAELLRISISRQGAAEKVKEQSE